MTPSDFKHAATDAGHDADSGSGASDSPKVTGTAAFSKFMTVLQAISDADTPPSASQLALACGYPRPTVYRIVGALLAQGLVIEQPPAGTYVPGPRLIHLARRSLQKLDIRAAATEALRVLRDATGETVHLAVRAGHEMVYVDKLESLHTVRMASQIGSSVTLYSSSVGKAYMAALPQAERDLALEGVTFRRFTEHTITDRVQLHQELALTRERGYAEDREENEADIFCYGCAVLDQDRKPVGAVSISVPRFRQTATPGDTFVAPLINACREISLKLRR
jgi:DNA-binding IclR family transcriptional regulator